MINSSIKLIQESGMPSNYSSMTVGVHASAGTEEVLAAYDRSPIAVVETSDETEVEQALSNV
jgi:hypothetical protein